MVVFYYGTLIDSTEHRLSDTASVFQAEIHGLDLALNFVMTLQSWGIVRIFSDSLSLLKALSFDSSLDPEIWCLKGKLHSILQSRQLSLHWVPAHKGILGNEMADYHAKNATQHPSVDCSVPKPRRLLTRELQNALLLTWQERWVLAEKGRQTADFFPHVGLQPHLFSPHVMQIITGHGRFPAYFCRMGLLPSDLCACGEKVFTAEIAAVLLALEQISDFLGRKFIYTDSLSVLESLKSFYIHSYHHPLVLNVLHLLNKLASRDFNILLCWVPSHVGIVGNEEADKAAKLASTQTNSTVPLTDFKKYTKVLFYSKWQRQWDTETENKLRAVKPHVQPWPSLMNRKADTLLTRLRVGHTRYTHRHLLLGEQAPMCSQCNCSMSVQHILSECPNFNSQRLHFFRVDSVDLSLLLGKAPHVNLFAFLRSIGFYPHI
ncbi:hypothetical protein AVEN_113145-1 [Araneus ventricosus]|uniref:ribonuclease H n=1 Tax=Araneus ventricosus TaxID=182803 RepID=A0A4Y2TYC9_ARAVE|nr:hypothetical protein AVEN_113145-1 [Araneus ventricosus]